MKTKIIASSTTQESLLKAVRAFFFSETTYISEDKFYNSKGEIPRYTYRVKKGRHQMIIND